MGYSATHFTQNLIMPPLAVLSFVNHALNFAAPALWLACLVPLVARILIRKTPAVCAWYVQIAIHGAVGLAALCLGLSVFGHDGKMLTYLALVLLCATTQWLMIRK